MPSLLLIQWGLVGFFVLFHFIIGFFRGTAKSTYYTLVSIVLSFIILWVVSGISVSSYISNSALIELIQSNTGNAIPQDFVDIISQPEVFAFVIAIVDVIVRIVAFLILYTVIRFVITFVVFGLLWNQVLKNKVNQWFKLTKVIVKGDEEVEKAEVLSKRYKTFGDRLGGALVGGVRGFITTFILLLPIMVLATTTENLTFNNVAELSSEQTLSQTSELESLVPNEIIDIIGYVNELNENNLSQVFGGLGNALFDFAFETKLGDAAFNLRDELNVITQIVDVAYDNGYLDTNFNVESLSSQDVQTIQTIIGLISESKLVTEGLALGSDVLASGLLEELLGFSFEGRLGDNSLQTLASLDWELELNQLAVVIEKVLAFASVSELLDLTNDTDALLNLTSEEATQLADILRAVADLQLVKLIPAGVDYATTLSEAQNLIEWLPLNEREAYLQEVLVDIVSNTEFFYGENGDLYNLADLIEIIFASYGDFALSLLLSENLEIQNLLVDDVQAFAEATLQGLAEVDTLVAVLPLAFDFALYGALEAQDASVLSDDLAEALETLDLSAEFSNVTDIYQTLIQLGVGAVLEENADLIAFLDEVIENNLAQVRTLVDQVFVKSVLVQTLLENGVSIGFELALEEGDLKTLLEALLFEDGDLVFEVGAELVKLIDVLEAIGEVATLEEILDALGDQALLFDLIDEIAVNKNQETKDLIEQIFNLTLVDRVLNEKTAEVIDFVLEPGDLKDLAMMFVFQGGLALDLESDLYNVLDILSLGYTFTSLSGLLDASESITIDTLVALADAFGSVAQADALTLVGLLTGLSIFDVLDAETLKDVASFAGLDSLYVSDDVDLKAEITNLLLPVYLTAHFMHENLKAVEAKDIDFAPLLGLIKPYFLASENNQLLVQNFAYNLESLITTLNLEDFLYVPRTLAGTSPESADWANEYNAVVGSVFTLLETLSIEVKLSNQYLATLSSNLMNANLLEILVLLNTEEKVDQAIGALLNSKILRASLPVIAASFSDALEGVIPNLTLGIPELALEGEMLKEDALLDVFAPILSILYDGMNEAKFVSINDALHAVEIVDLIALYDFAYGTQVEDFDALAASDLVRGLLSHVLLDDAFVAFAQGIVEDALGANLTTAFALNRDNDLLTVEEIQDVFTILHDLALPKSLVVSPDGRINLASDAIFGYIQSIDEPEFEVLFDNVLLNDLLTSVLKDPGLQAFAQDFFDDAVGATLDSLSTSLGLSTPLGLDVAGFVEGFANINNEYGQFDLRELIPFIKAYQKLDIERYADFLFINTAEDVAVVFEAFVTDEYVLEALDSRFIKYPFGFVLSDEVFAASIANIVNSFTTELGHTFSDTAFAFDSFLFEENGDLKVEYIGQMVAAAYAILNLDQGFTIDALLGLGEQVRIFGLTDSILDHILNVEVLFQIIDKITIDKEVMSGLAKVLENVLNDQIATSGLGDILSENGLQSQITLNAYQLPNVALDENFRFSRAEIRALLNIFVALNMTSFEELSVLSTTQGIYETIKNTSVVEAILSSNWINYMISSGLNNPALYQGLATSIEEVIKQTLNVVVEIDPSIFNLAEEKYAIFNEVEGELLIKASEVKHLLLTALSVDLSGVTFGAGLGVIDGVYELLELEDENGVSLIDNILQSRLVLAIFDKVLNLETDASNLRPVITAILNRVLADYLDGNLLDNHILAMRNITTQDGVIAASEIKALLYLGKLINTESTLGLSTVFSLFTSDVNNNQQGDFEDIFASNIILSIVSNLVANPSVRRAATAFLENAANDTLAQIALFDGFVFDGAPIALIFDALTDSEGNFDYNQIRRLFNIVGVLGITSEAALNNLDLVLLLNTMFETLYETTIDGRNAVRYLAETDVLRALLDAFVLEQDQGYAWGLETIMGLLSDNAPQVDPNALTMPSEMRALDDENGLITSEHMYEFLLSILAQDVRGFLGFNGDLGGLLEGFFENPIDGLNKDRIEFLYGSQVIEILLSGILDDHTLEAALATYISDLAQDALDQQGLAVESRLFGFTDLNITFDLLDEAAFRQTLIALSHLELESISDLSLLSDPYYVFEKLAFPLSNEKMMDLIEVPLINHVLKLVFSVESIEELAQAVVTQALESVYINVEITTPIIGLPFEVDNQDLYDLVYSIYVLGLFDFENYSLLSVQFFTDLLNSNIEVETGKDDFDRVLASDILYTIVNNLFLLDIQAIAEAFGGRYYLLDLSSIDFTLPQSVIAAEGDDVEALEIGRISKAAWRDLFEAIRALNIDEVLASGSLGVNVLTDLIDLENQNTDALSTFLASDIIYAYIARLIDSEVVSDFIVEGLPQELLDLLGDFSINSPLDARNDTNPDLEAIGEVISRHELYLVIRSLKYLNIDLNDINPNYLSYIFSLVGENEVAGVDDFDRFIESKYFQDKLSSILLADYIVELIAQDLFTTQAFFDTLPETGLMPVGADGFRIAEAEFARLFASLQTLGLTDLSNVTFGVDSLTALTEAELTDVLASEYVYTIINLILLGQDAIAIPASAIETTGDYSDMIKKSEIINILKALEILGGDLGNIDVNNLTIQDLQDLFDLNSSLVDSLLEEGLSSVLTIPTEAYLGGVLNRDEISQTIAVLLVLANNDPTTRLSTIDVANLTFSVTLIQSIQTAAPESHIIDNLLSEALLEALDVPSRAIDQTFSYDYVAISQVVDALNILGITTLDSNVSVDGVTIAKYQALVALESYIIDRLLSGIILSSGLDIPTASLDTLGDITKDITRAELAALGNALLILNNNDNTGVVDTVLANVDAEALSPSMLEDLLALNSPLINRLVASGVIATNLVDSSQYAVLGDTNFDLNAVDQDIKLAELNHIVASLQTLGVTSVSGISSITVENVQALTEAEIQTILGGTTTFMYYVIEDIVDTTGTDIITAYETAEGPLERVDGRITRAELIAVLTYEPVIPTALPTTLFYLTNANQSGSASAATIPVTISSTDEIDSKLLTHLNYVQNQVTYASLEEYFNLTNPSSKFYALAIIGLQTLSIGNPVNGIVTFAEYNAWKLSLATFNYPSGATLTIDMATYTDISINPNW